MAANAAAEVESYLGWYDRKATRARGLFVIARTIELGAATAIPIVAFSNGSALLNASLGALIAVVAGFEHLLRFQETWINYRQTAEALRIELFLYRSGAGPYAAIEGGFSADQLIASRTAELLMQENARWNAIAKKSANGADREATLPSSKA